LKNEVEIFYIMKKTILMISLLFTINIVSAQITIDSNQFIDDAQKYVGKKVTIWGSVNYSFADQSGSYNEIKSMTLRTKDNNFENIHSSYYYELSEAEWTKYYCRNLTISSEKVILLIPKKLSLSVPNGTTVLGMKITGIVKSPNIIEIISIKRDQY